MTAPRIEILHSRDPDAECEFDLFVNGEHVRDFTLADVDPGRGHERVTWDEHTDSVENDQSYSPAFREAVVKLRDEVATNKYIDGDPSIRLRVKLTNVYSDDTVIEERWVRTPEPPDDTEPLLPVDRGEREDWAAEYLMPLTGTGRTSGDAGYFVEILEAPDRPDLVGSEFEWGI